MEKQWDLTVGIPKLRDGFMPPSARLFCFMLIFGVFVCGIGTKYRVINIYNHVFKKQVKREESTERDKTKFVSIMMEKKGCTEIILVWLALACMGGRKSIRVVLKWFHLASFFFLKICLWIVLSWLFRVFLVFWLPGNQGAEHRLPLNSLAWLLSGRGPSGQRLCPISMHPASAPCCQARAAGNASLINKGYYSVRWESKQALWDWEAEFISNTYLNLIQASGISVSTF